jgi:hypothetical protein
VHHAPGETPADGVLDGALDHLVGGRRGLTRYRRVDHALLDGAGRGTGDSRMEQKVAHDGFHRTQTEQGRGGPRERA